MPTAEVCRRHGISSCDLLQVEVEVWRARGVCCARLRFRTPGGVRRWTGQAMACFATPYGLRYAAHCFNRAHAQQRGPAL